MCCGFWWRRSGDNRNACCVLSHVLPLISFSRLSLCCSVVQLLVAAAAAAVRWIYIFRRRDAMEDQEIQHFIILLLKKVSIMIMHRMRRRRRRRPRPIINKCVKKLFNNAARRLAPRVQEAVCNNTRYRRSRAGVIDDRGQALSTMRLRE